MVCKAVFFDIDGTLVDSNCFHVDAWAQAFAEAGHAIDRAAIAAQIGKGEDNLVPALLASADARAAKTLGERHGTIFKDQFLDRVRPFAGAHDLVARVRDGGRRVVLASSASREELDHYVTLLGIERLVDARTTIDDVAHSKPAPDIFVAAQDKVAPIAAEAIVVIGDSPFDMEPAAYCGMVPVAVRSGGFDDASLSAAGAAAVYDDVAALLAQFEASAIAA